MNSSETHPARSPEFLSRLHDGELEPAERARFEAHRAHCAECRDAAAQLEEALAFFRSSRPGPAAPDLSARILRKLRAVSPRRRPFGQVFGIDVRWAGAFATALLAVIIGSSIVLERDIRDRRVVRDSGAIPIVIQQRTAVASASETKQRRIADSTPLLRKKNSARTEPGKPPSVKDEAPRAQSENRETASQPVPSDELAPAPPAPAIAAAAPRADAPARRKAVERSADLEERSAAVGGRLRAEAQGGEGGAPAAGVVAQEKTQPMRIRVIAADAQGLAPEPSNAAELSLSAADRGEYLVIVRSDGTVASVRPTDTNRDSGGTEIARRRAADELRKLRFAVADRPRHLTLRVE